MRNDRKLELLKRERERDRERSSVLTSKDFASRLGGILNDIVRSNLKGRRTQCAMHCEKIILQYSFEESHIHHQ